MYFQSKPLAGPTLLVAASDAPARVKSQADYVCDGTADEVQINAAILRAAPRYDVTGETVGRSNLVPATGTEMFGKVQLSGGIFRTASPCLMYSGVVLEGQGPNTVLWPANTFSDAGAGTTGDTAVIKLADYDQHHVTIRDVYLYGNYLTGDDCRHGIYLDNSGTSTTKLREWPNTDPDPELRIKDVFIAAFKNPASGARYGVWIRGNNTTGGTYVNRAAKLTGIAVRQVETAGIYLQAAPDGHVHDCHVGTSDGAGFLIAGANQKITSCKAFYCETYGFQITSSKGTMGNCESQDSVRGILFDASPYVATGIVVDTHLSDGIVVSSSKVVINGFDIFNRSGGRSGYDPQAYGIRWDGAYTQGSYVGIVDLSAGAAITTPIAGTTQTAANGNFARISSRTATLSSETPPNGLYLN